MTPRFDSVRTRGLCRAFDEHYALIGLDTSFPAGSVTALLGPNGAGKSTLMRILSTLAQPTEGGVWFGEEQLDDDTEHLRGAVGYVGHHTMIYPALTARENLAFFARLYGSKDADIRADRLLDTVGLPLDKDRMASGFSRGMGQRLAIARALIHEPSLLLLDEPFSGLDTDGVEMASGLFRQVADDGAIVVLASHDLETTGLIADRALILRRGQAVHDGPIEGSLAELYRSTAGQRRAS